MLCSASGSRPWRNRCVILNGGYLCHVPKDGTVEDSCFAHVSIWKKRDFPKHTQKILVLLPFSEEIPISIALCIALDGTAGVSTTFLQSVVAIGITATGSDFEKTKTERNSGLKHEASPTITKA